MLDRGEGCYVCDTTRAALRRRALEPVLLPARLLLRRARWPRPPREQLSGCRSTPTGPPPTRPAIELAERVARIAPPDIEHVFFTSGGSESVESAWKLVRQYHVANGEPRADARRSPAARAYHGVTLGALSFTGVEPLQGAVRPGRRCPTPPRLQHQRLPLARCRAPSSRARCWTSSSRRVLAEGPETVAMIIAEPVQNAGGCLVPPDGLLAGPARARRPPRHPARRRRGDHRLRPARRVVRRAPLRALGPT